MLLANVFILNNSYQYNAKTIRDIHSLNHDIVEYDDLTKISSDVSHQIDSLRIRSRIIKKYDSIVNGYTRIEIDVSNDGKRLITATDLKKVLRSYRIRFKEKYPNQYRTKIKFVVFSSFYDVDQYKSINEVFDNFEN